LRRQGHRGDVRLVAHFGEKEGDQGCAEHAESRSVASLSSSLSGVRVQMAIPMNDTPSTQRKASGVRSEVIHDPSAPANA